MTGPAYIDAIMASDSYKKLQEEKYGRGAMARQYSKRAVDAEAVGDRTVRR